MVKNTTSRRQLTLRLEPGAFERLAAQSNEVGKSPTEFAKILLEEGLRMQAHPGIIFRSGPAGRRPGLASGPDIWEIARIMREFPVPGEKGVLRTSELMGLPANKVRVAQRYYADFRDEVDDWLRILDEEADQAEAAWRREQGLPVS